MFPSGPAPTPFPGGVKSLEADGSETAGEEFSQAGSKSVQIGQDGKVSFAARVCARERCGQ